MNPTAELRERLFSDSEDARFEAWRRIYHSPETEIGSEIPKIIAGDDPVLKIQLARFLAAIPEQRAIIFLCKLLCEENPPIVEAARKSFEKNQYAKKTNELLSVLSAPLMTAQIFAIEKLSTGGVMESLTPIIQLLLTGPQDLIPKILTALRYLPDKMLIQDLMPFFQHENADYRFKTTLVYGAVHEIGVVAARGKLIDALKDTDVRVRQAAIWSLRRRPSRIDQRLISEIADHDSDPAVRKEAVVNLGLFPKIGHIARLLAILTTDKSRMVSLKAEAILLALPRPLLLKGLRKTLQNPTSKSGKRALLLFAEFAKNSERFLRNLNQQLNQSKTDPERLVFIEAIGVLGNRKAVPLLQKFLNSPQPIISYGALSAMLKIYDRSNDFPYLDYLNSKSVSDILKQMILKHFLKNEKSDAYPPNMLEYLTRTLDHSNLNLRYLSALALARLPHDQSVNPLLQLILKEENPLLTKFLNRSIAQLLSGTPMRLGEQLLFFQFNANAIDKILTLAHEIDFDSELILSMVSKLLTPEFDFLITDHLQRFCQFLSRQILHNRISLDQLIKLTRYHQDNTRILSQIIGILESFPNANPQTRSDVFIDDLLIHHTIDPNILVELMAFSHQEEILRTLVSIIANPALKTCHEKASAGLRYNLGLGT